MHHAILGSSTTTTATATAATTTTAQILAIQPKENVLAQQETQDQHEKQRADECKGEMRMGEGGCVGEGAHGDMCLTSVPA
jgi:hypothetical protein